MASIRSCDSLIITSKGAMPGSRRGIASRSIRMPVPARSAVSEVAHVMPAAPEVLQTLHQALLDQLQAGLDEQLLRERVADLHGRPLGARLVAEGGAGKHGGAADPVASRGRPEQHRQVARPGAAARVRWRSSSTPTAMTLTSGFSA